MTPGSGDGAAQPMAPGHSLQAQDGLSLFLREWSPDGPSKGTVLIVHGFAEHSGRYEGVAAALNASGFKAVAFDLRGHGQSGGARGGVGSFDLFLSDLDVVLEHVRQVSEGPMSLYGHSMGGLIAVRYLQTRRPLLASAVISAPWFATKVKIALWKRLLARVLRATLPDLPLTTPSNPKFLTRDPVLQQAHREDPLVHRRISTRFYYEVVEAQKMALADTHQADLPLLVLVPLDDRSVDQSYTRRWVRERKTSNITAWELPEVRHEPHNDLGREELLERVGMWLGQIPQNTP